MYSFFFKRQAMTSVGPVSVHNKNIKNFHSGYYVISLMMFQAERASVILTASSMTDRNTVRQTMRKSMFSGIDCLLLSVSRSFDYRPLFFL